MSEKPTKPEDKYEKLMKLEDEMLEIARKLKVVRELKEDLEHN